MQLLFRKIPGTEEEYEVAKRYFDVITQRANIRTNELVVGRYSMLPGYKEVATDIRILGGAAINSYPQHKWIADFEYYQDLKKYTFQSWTVEEFPRSTHPGPFVVKGRTNSAKWKWRTHMFAPDRRAAAAIAAELATDSHIGPQGVIYREYIPLKADEVDPVCGIPYANEYRFFFLGKTLVSAGFYWNIAEGADKKEVPEEAEDFARLVAEEAAQYATFFVLDVAEKAEGGWVLVEINDGQCSGLSCMEPEAFYRNLLAKLEEQYGT